MPFFDFHLDNDVVEKIFQGVNSIGLHAKGSLATLHCSAPNVTRPGEEGGSTTQPLVVDDPQTPNLPADNWLHPYIKNVDHLSA